MLIIFDSNYDSFTQGWSCSVAHLVPQLLGMQLVIPPNREDLPALAKQVCRHLTLSIPLFLHQPSKTNTPHTHKTNTYRRATKSAGGGEVIISRIAPAAMLSKIAHISGTANEYAWHMKGMLTVPRINTVEAAVV